jgi:hypothetical protein
MLLWRRCTLLHQMRRWFVQRTADFAHDLRKIVGWNHDQRDQENQEYFEYTQVQIAQMPIPLLPGGSYVPNPMPALSYCPRPSVRATDRLIFAVVRA